MPRRSKPHEEARRRNGSEGIISRASAADARRVTVRMKLLLIPMIALLIAIEDPKDEAVKKEMRKLEGVWRVVSADGQKVTQEQSKNYTLSIAGNKYIIKKMGKIVYEGTVRIDASKRPKTIDVTKTSGEFPGTVRMGIYQIDGESLKICYGLPCSDRPTEFKGGSAAALVVFKREKCAKGKERGDGK